MLAATAGGFALGTAGTAAAHAIQYPVGALTHTPHGVGVGALLPYVMEFNRPARIAELADVARAMGPPPDGTPEELADAGDRPGRGAPRHRSASPPRSPSSACRQDRLRWTAEQSLSAARLVENNPRPLDVDAARAHRPRRAHRRPSSPARRRAEPSRPDRGG